MSDSFGARRTMAVGGKDYHIHSLEALQSAGARLERLPYCLRILLENLLRHEDGVTVTESDIRALVDWDPAAVPAKEICFSPARVLLQDFTGVPCVVDLAAMRDAMARMGGDPAKIDPLQPVELVIDHSVQMDEFGSPDALGRNVQIEFERNRERYQFLKWGQQAFGNFRVVPPSTGIVHQVNLEYLARVVFSTPRDGSAPLAYPDTVVGTDSHTTMINGLGVLGWGVGGIEAEAAMLGQPISMLIPQVVGFRLSGRLREGVTATDLVLTVTQMLRAKGVVGKFVEFFGPGLASLPLADRATLANMAPEYGATCGIFPVDGETLAYLRATGRQDEQVALIEAYMKEQGLFHTPETPPALYSDVVELDMGSVEASIAGPRRPQDRIPLPQAREAFRAALPQLAGPAGDRDAGKQIPVTLEGQEHTLSHGSIVIAAITSCTNTSNPSVMLAAGLLAKKAVERGLRTKPWVKTTLAPGSRVVTEYLRRSGLDTYLDALRFNNAGYGCASCIGNSGPLPEPVSKAIADGSLVACSVLSGNRNFEGRISPEVRANYLMSPPLVVAFALAGRIDIDLTTEPLGTDGDGQPVYLRDLWPGRDEIRAAENAISSGMFRETYAQIFEGDENWRGIAAPRGALFEWDPESSYVRNPPYFDAMPVAPPDSTADIAGARALAYLGDSITTDHISPAGSIRAASPAGAYLMERGVQPGGFNSYGSRRGNHEVMVRGTFANVRIRNRLAPGTEGGFTTHIPSGEVMTIYDAAARYAAEGAPLIVLAGKEYGSGSSRDWAAKGPYLQGVGAVLAESYERIHRSNLIGMGIVPLQFQPGESAESLGLTGQEEFDIVGLSEGLAAGFASGRTVRVRAKAADAVREFTATARIDTPKEADYYRHGGILQYVLRQLLGGG